MKQKDIIEGTQVVLDWDATRKHYSSAYREVVDGGHPIVATVVAKNEPRQDRNDGVRVRVNDLEVVVYAGHIERTLADYEEGLRLAAEAKEREEAEEHERTIRLGQMANDEALGYHVRSLMYSPADPAVDLVSALDNLIEQATAIKAQITEGFEGDPADFDGYRAKRRPPRRDEDGDRIMPRIIHNVSWLTNGYSKVVGALAVYEHRAGVFNVLSSAGVDFDVARDIFHGRDEEATA